MPKIECVCLQCGKKSYRYPSVLKKGYGNFCSQSCATTYRNIHDNPSKRPEVRKKISEHHADVSGENNPMHGIKGKESPNYKDGRSYFQKASYIGILLASGRDKKCEICGSTDNIDVHHVDGNHKNNTISNLMWVCRKCHNTKCHIIVRDRNGRVKTQIINKNPKGGDANVSD